jgi:hypothetical protein
VNYLQERPYKEVAAIIGEMAKLQPVEPESNKKQKEA